MNEKLERTLNSPAACQRCPNVPAFYQQINLFLPSIEIIWFLKVLSLIIHIFDHIYSKALFSQHLATKKNVSMKMIFMNSRTQVLVYLFLTDMMPSVNYSASPTQIPSHPQRQQHQEWGLEPQVPVRATSLSLAQGASEGTAEFHRSGWKLGALHLAHTIPGQKGRIGPQLQTHNRIHQNPPGVLGKAESLYPQCYTSGWGGERSASVKGNLCSPSLSLHLCTDPVLWYHVFKEHWRQ